MSDKWTLLMVGPEHGIVGSHGHPFQGHPDFYERVDVVRADRADAALAERDAEIERLRANMAALEDEKNTYIDYVGDALGQAADGETLWDAAQRVLSERDNLRADLAATLTLREACQAALRAIDTYAAMYRHHMTVQLYSARAGLRDALGRGS